MLDGLCSGHRRTELTNAAQELVNPLVIGEVEMSFINNFLLDPWRYRSLALAKFRWSQLLRERSNGAFDALYSRWCRCVRPEVALPPPRRMSAEAVSDTVRELSVEGCKVLPFSLSADEIDALREFAFLEPAYAVDIAQQIRIEPDAIPRAHGRYYWPMHRLVQNPVVRDLLTDSTVLSIAQGYLGSEPLLSSVSLWLDPVFDGLYDPHVYHYDNDGPGFLKFFFYLTDVDEESGAHRFIRRTHHPRKPTRFAASRRYEDTELVEYYGADQEVVFCAPAGTVIAEDTSGFHRGSDLRHGYRLLLQFEFSLLDIPHEEDLRKVTRPQPFPGLDPRFGRILRKFYCA